MACCALQAARAGTALFPDCSESRAQRRVSPALLCCCRRHGLGGPAPDLDAMLRQFQEEVFRPFFGGMVQGGMGAIAEEMQRLMDELEGRGARACVGVCVGRMWVRVGACGCVWSWTSWRGEVRVRVWVCVWGACGCVWVRVGACGHGRAGGERCARRAL